MATTNEIATFDTTPYESAPLLTSDATLSLLRSLERAKPVGAPAYVEKAASRLIVTAIALEQNMIDRVDGAGISVSSEVEFDISCDRLWADARKRLEHVMHYADNGLELLDTQARDKIDLEHKRTKAAVARELDSHLFGIDGLGFLGKPFVQQVEQMASRLNFIRSSGSAEAYEEVLGEELLVTLEVVQDRYEEMVHDRATRESRTGQLRDLRYAAQRHITAYARAVLTLLDEDEPTKTRKLVEDALRPIANARSRRGSTGVVEGGVDPTDALEANGPALADEGGEPEPA